MNPPSKELLGPQVRVNWSMTIYDRPPARREGRLHGIVALREAIHHGAVKRLRPKFITVATMMLGLVPIV